MSAWGNDVVISGMPSYPVGVGYVIMPNDMPREKYLQIIKRTGYCQIITSDQIVVNNVAVPLHLIDQIVVPTEPGVEGSMVTWVCVYKTNQLILTGILLKPGEMNPLGEGLVTNQAKQGISPITQVFDPTTGTYSLNVNVADGNTGSIVLNIKGNKVTISSDGQIRIDSSDSIITVAENSYKFQLGTEKGKISTLELTDGILNYTDYNNNHFKIDAAKASLESPTIELGSNATEPMVLGTQMFNIMTELFIALETLVVNAAGVPSPLMPTSITQLTQIQAKLSNFLSTSITVK